MFLASLVTVIPAIGIIYFMLRRYEGYFDEGKMFFGLIVGLFAGLVVAAFEFVTNFAAPDVIAAAGVGTAFLFFVLGYAFFETGIKAIVLGLGRFRGRKDTPYYGMALGLALGSMVAMMIIANALRAGEAFGTPYNWTKGLAMALIPAGGMLTHGATGSWVGLGSAQGKLWKGWGIGTLLQAPVLLLYWFWWPSIGQGTAPLAAGIGTSVTSIIYGATMLWLTRRKVLDAVVPKDIQDQVRRHNRREQRRVTREGDENE